MVGATVSPQLGEVRYAAATRNILKAVRGNHAATVRKAHKIKQMLSRLYSWADENDFVPGGFNPAKGIKRLKRKGGDNEIVVWCDVEVELFLKGAPPHLVTPVLVALYTGQRREDVVKMTRKQFQGDVIRVRQSKTTALLDIACHAALRRHLDKLPRKGVVICTTAEGRRSRPTACRGQCAAVSKRCRTCPTTDRCTACGMPPDHEWKRRAALSLRSKACSGTRQTFKMALKYASQRLRAAAAMAKMEAAEGA